MRRTPEQQLAELEATQAQLLERKKKIQRQISQKERKERTRRIAIIGSVVEAHGEKDPEFHNLIWTILKNHVTRKADREFLGLDADEDDATEGQGVTPPLGHIQKQAAARSEAAE